MAFTFHEGDLDSADVQTLLAIHYERAQATSAPECCHALSYEELRSPKIVFWSIRKDGAKLLGMGALEELTSEHAELKSLRTAADVLRCGVGSAMLAHILAEARKRGYRRLSLEVGTAPEYTPALRFYERHGFQPCGSFAGYEQTPLNLFMASEL